MPILERKVATVLLMKLDNLIDLTDGEVLLRLDELSKEHNLKLAFAQKKFFVLLLHYCEKSGTYDSSRNMCYVELSVGDFVQLFHLSHTSIVVSLSQLQKIGAISRVEQKRSFRPLKSGYKVNQPYKTYINIDFLFSNDDKE